MEIKEIEIIPDGVKVNVVMTTGEEYRNVTWKHGHNAWASGILIEGEHHVLRYSQIDSIEVALPKYRVGWYQTPGVKGFGGLLFYAGRGVWYSHVRSQALRVGEDSPVHKEIQAGLPERVHF